MFKYKSLKEQLTGFYQLGDEYYILADTINSHFAYTAVHERIHANLGSASSFGVFQKIIYRFKSELINQKTIEYFDFLLDSTIQNVITAHESAATFHQFSIARHDKYIGLNEMFESLPKEYKDWKEIFEILFNESKIPYRAQGWIAYHISRVSMETNILDDFKNLVPSLEIKKYFLTKNNNPNERQLRIIDFLLKEKIDLVFIDYLNYYKSIENKLDELYLNRSINNREQSLQFQRKLLNITDRISNQILSRVGLSCPIIDSWSHAHSANELIEQWKYQLYESKSINPFNYKIISTDSLSIDPLDLAEIIIPPRNQLSGLTRIDDSPIFSDIYVARIWIHKSDIPFKLTDHLHLNKNNLYIRYYGFHNRTLTYYNLKDNTLNLALIIKHPVISILCDGSDYKFIKAVNFNSFNGLIFFYWQKYEEIPKEIITEKKIKMYLIFHPNFSIAIFQNNITFHYYLYFFSGNSFIEQIKAQSEQLIILTEIDVVISPIIDIIMCNFNHIF